MTELIAIKNLTISVKNKKLLENFNLKINKGEKLAFVGSSGSGKTTLGKALINIVDKGVKVESGKIIFNGKNIFSMDRKALRKIRGNEIGYIFQSSLSALNPVDKIISQVKDTYFSHYKDEIDIEEKSLEILKALGFENEEGIRILNSYPFELSGGQAARAYILLILILNPKLIIADESFAEIDNINRQHLYNYLNSLNKLGKTIILISHNDFLVRNFTEKIIYFG